MNFQTENTLCIEIKLKNNIPSRSPFVEPDRGIKLRLGRFKLMQLYKLGKGGNCNWGHFEGDKF